MTLVFAKEEEETQRHMLFGRQGQEGISGFTRKVVASGEDARVCYFIFLQFPLFFFSGRITFFRRNPKCFLIFPECPGTSQYIEWH